MIRIINQWLDRWIYSKGIPEEVFELSTHYHYQYGDTVSDHTGQTFRYLGKGKWISTDYTPITIRSLFWGIR